MVRRGGSRKRRLGLDPGQPPLLAAAQPRPQRGRAPALRLRCRGGGGAAGAGDPLHRSRKLFRLSGAAPSGHWGAAPSGSRPCCQGAGGAGLGCGRRGASGGRSGTATPLRSEPAPPAPADPECPPLPVARRPPQLPGAAPLLGAGGRAGPGRPCPAAPPRPWPRRQVAPPGGTLRAGGSGLTGPGRVARRGCGRPLGVSPGGKRAASSSWMLKESGEAISVNRHLLRGTWALETP